MRKKKTIILAGLLLVMAHTAFAEETDVFLEFHRWDIPENSKEVNRAPLRLPIEVVYDSGTNTIYVEGNEMLEVQVLLYNSNGILEASSSILNTEFHVLTSGIHIIKIQGEGWYAIGEFEI